MTRKPPRKRARERIRWAVEKTSFLKELFENLSRRIIRFFLSLFNLHSDVEVLIKRSFHLGNPAETEWPSETLPMVSRLLAAGFWNYSFFQFNRRFFFPYWAQKQYDPRSESFIPRSHNLLSMNQTHRNWLSVSYPGKTSEISIDRAGAIMPYIDGYTIEMAVLQENGQLVRPHDNVEKLQFAVPRLGVAEMEWKGRRLFIYPREEGLRIKGKGSEHLVISIRPFNVEGPSFLNRLEYNGRAKHISGDVNITLKNNPEFYLLSTLENGDALLNLAKGVKVKPGSFSLRKKRRGESRVKDKSGLATGAFYFEKASDFDCIVFDKVKYRSPAPLVEGIEGHLGEKLRSEKIWQKWFPGLTEIKLPAPYQDLFTYSRNHLLTLWDYDSITPGSYTYHHFWIRDAVLMLKALMLVGGQKATRPVIDRFHEMISRKGLFKSQKGEWDGNGQALWLLGEYSHFTGDTEPLQSLKKQCIAMVRWLHSAAEKNGGVLPPGFSAEHLGVADWYLWDNFWALGGYQSLQRFGHLFHEVDFNEEYRYIHESMKVYLEGYKYYPAAFGRQKDAGMIGSICAVYPLQLPDYFDKRMLKTLEIIKERYFFKGGFFQENIHSGVNPYLSIQTAEAYLMMGDSQTAFSIFESIVKKSAFAYTYPEAVHPKTKGGCMGDGFHGWAFAEMVTLVRNFFIYEYEERFILLAGIPVDWFKEKISARNLHTARGVFHIEINNGRVLVETNAGLDKIEISIPTNMTVSGDASQEKFYASIKIQGRQLYSLGLENGRADFKIKKKD